jgi:hypothetical protein
MLSRRAMVVGGGVLAVAGSGPLSRTTRGAEKSFLPQVRLFGIWVVVARGIVMRQKLTCAMGNCGLE